MFGKIAQKLGIPIVLVLAGFGFCFLVLELGLRGLEFDPMAELAEGRSLILRESHHPLRLFELTPHSSGFAWRTQVEINSHGMRDREYPIERTGAPRIAVIGDSITFGSGVARGDRFTDRLENLLAERLGGPVEVLNLGVGGYDTLQEVATLEDVGLRFTPDLVVVAYCVNDVGDNSPNLAYIQSLANANSRLYRLRIVQLIRVISDKLRLMRRLRADNRDDRFAARFRGHIASVSGDRELGTLRAELAARMERTGESDLRLEWYLSDAHLGKVEFAFDWLRDLAREHDFGVVLAIVPFLGESESYDVVYRIVEHMSLRHGFETVDLKPSLSAAGFESVRSRERDSIHPNEHGHRLIAEALEPVVAAKLGQRAAAGRQPGATGKAPL